MSNELLDQEKRSREIADKLRTYLTALNTGGIAITFRVAGSLASQKVVQLGQSGQWLGSWSGLSF